MVVFLSQIGWTENNYSTSPAKIIEFERIYIDFDTYGINTIIPETHLHGKMPHRFGTLLRVSEFLCE